MICARPLPRRGSTPRLRPPPANTPLCRTPHPPSGVFVSHSTLDALSRSETVSPPRQKHRHQSTESHPRILNPINVWHSVVAAPSSRRECLSLSYKPSRDTVAPRDDIQRYLNACWSVVNFQIGQFYSLGTCAVFIGLLVFDEIYNFVR